MIIPQKDPISKNAPTKNPLNPAQQEAATSNAKALLIVAGAGTGKTKTITARIAHLIATGTDPSAICALTFTNKAAKEMKDRAAFAITQSNTPLPFNYDDMFIGTFHSFGARFLKKNSIPVGRTVAFTIYDQSDSLQLIKSIIKNKRRPGTYEKDSEELKPAAISEKISAIKNGWLSYATLEHSSYPPDAHLIAIYDKYEQTLAENNAFDFDDLIEKTVRILKTNPTICSAIQGQIRFLLVDEYQDINALQFDLIKLLVGQEAAITVVGDDAQTIYTWRGSDIRFFLEFDQHFKNAKTVFLEENYRSHKIILDAAQAVIAHNKQQKPKILKAQVQTGEKILVIETTSEAQEAGEIIGRIAQSSPNSHSSTPITTAILYRTNAQSRPLEQALVASGIAYIIYGGIRFYDRKEIKDIIGALRLIHNPHDQVSRDRLETAFTKTRFKELEDLLRAEKKYETPAEAIRAFLIATNYGDYLQKYLKNFIERKQNIQELLRFAGEFQDLGLFLEQVSLVQATDKNTKSKNPVQLMSVHAAKGLEFDNVYVVGVQEGLLPHPMSLKTQAQIEEERRLLYVAITRAKKRLTLSYHGQPSRFLFEIPQELTLFESVGSIAQSLDDTSDERYITFD